MRRFLPAVPLVGVPLVGVFLAVVGLASAAPLLAKAWSQTRPAVNETHVFEGEVNRRGKPVGFHSRPGGRDPRGARVVRVVEGPNRAGVYVAMVEIRDPDGGRWLGKRSTLFPDDWTRGEVLAAIVNAWEHRTTGSSEHFRGPSGRGFTIEGYLLSDGTGRINTAYPIFQAGGRGPRP